MARDQIKEASTWPDASPSIEQPILSKWEKPSSTDLVYYCLAKQNYYFITVNNTIFLRHESCC